MLDKMHLKNIALKFNLSNFFVYSCLLVLSILLSLRVEGVILWSFGIVFLPLWVWKFVTLIAAIGGVVYWIRKKRDRKDPETRGHFMTMLSSTSLQLVLLIGEILIAVNLDLDTTRTLSWSAIFTPFYILVILSSVSCVLSCCCCRKFSIELEILGIVNLLQLIFLGIKLDSTTQWRWAVVLIPTWILLVVAMVCIAVYVCLQCSVISTEGAQRDGLGKPLVATNTICFSFAIVFFTLFLALLVSQLDGKLRPHYAATFVPLHISILFLFPTVVTRQSANPLWFGLHRNIVDIVLELSPSFKEYLNVSWTKEDLREKPVSLGLGSNNLSMKKLENKPAPDVEYPYIDIMMPD